MPRITLFVINLVGGLAVLGSYAVGISGHPGETDLLWGTLPEGIRGVYTLNMLPAAVGYLVAFGYLMATPPDDLQHAGAPALPALNTVYAAFLVSSAAWMPLCWVALDGGRDELIPLIRLVLILAGLSSAGLLLLLSRLTNPPRRRWWQASLVGMGFLVLQCAVLDALIWPQFFVIPH